MDTKELIRSKWTLFYFLTFSIISVGIIFSGEASEIYGFSGISKFIASLVNISFLLIPIFSLGPSSISISGMRENLSLEYMLSFPVTKKEIYLSKFLSIFLVSISTLFFVLFIALSFFRFREVDTKIITAFLFILLLSFVFISIGFLISVLSKTKSSAIALSLFVWFIIIIGGELGTLGFISVSKIPEISFFPIIFLNPAETFRVAVIAIFSSSLDILGPFGIYIYSKLGKSLIPISALLMSIYGFLTLVIGYKLFSMQKVSTDIIRRR
ncbi:MAG: ABC transporter permease [Candidatus Calescibacterium sp.]|nr:ABC transporter permease [Candidatus Calescibacterium sp.]MCX7733287.1 ABC transporter permease [bacterium]